MHETAIFHFRSKIWRHHRVSWSRFPIRSENLGDLRTFKADIYFIFAWIFRTSWPKMEVLCGKIGKGVVRYWPLMNSFFTFGFLTSVPILVKIVQEMRLWVLADGYTDRLTDWLTDANRFYNLSRAICYSYGTDNKQCSCKSSGHVNAKTAHQFETHLH